MAGSSAERELRDAVVAYLKKAMPMGRIVHEIACGGNRADLAVIEPSRLVLFELKSERDTMKRAEAQMRTFLDTSHAAVLVAHLRWFDQAPYANGSPRLAWPDEYDYRVPVWCYPEPPAGAYPANLHRWHLPRPSMRQPRAATFLELLWKDELLEECSRHSIAVSQRTRCPEIIDQMVWLMTGREICDAVCRQLRARRFVEADEPIREAA